MSAEKGVDTEKSICAEKDTNTEKIEENCEEREECELEKNYEDLKKDIKEIFDNPEYAYILRDVMEELRDLGYDRPGEVITYAIHNDLLYVDNVEESGAVYIALVDQDEEE